MLLARDSHGIGNQGFLRLRTCCAWYDIRGTSSITLFHFLFLSFLFESAHSILKQLVGEESEQSVGSFVLFLLRWMLFLTRFLSRPPSWLGRRVGRTARFSSLARSLARSLGWPEAALILTLEPHIISPES